MIGGIRCWWGELPPPAKESVGMAEMYDSMLAMMDRAAAHSREVSRTDCERCGAGKFHLLSVSKPRLWPERSVIEVVVCHGCEFCGATVRKSFMAPCLAGLAEPPICPDVIVEADRGAPRP